ncbi:MAG TPA: rod shape-determining protein MreC [Bacteroidales bacterium]|nr:MAG: rod shape-determining protein MreC [Bacteroidetes bacterium GWF2_33_38]OFY76659.1 MAG: rod shape-determining protein MreC [Bacteroidetes bacterium RIFOXYA12_FULL_33_9]OFY88372.1 MAG: rod shape-determining protein MreC [Bacteroidetes bacterium RIFOXYA2_FULL_33_7]HBF88292.1 rod shape-determining protein MreC [Bacteroidales bacterium]
MRSLLRLILRYHNILIFLILEIFAFILIVQNNKYQRASFFNSSNYAIGVMYGALNSISEYFNLKEINNQLAIENAAYKNMLANSFIFYNENFQLENDTLTKRKYSYLNAKIINNSVNRQTNFLTIDKGYKNGVEPDMGVVSPNGVVGVVKNVSENFSTVISVLNINLRISAKIKKNNYFGSLQWDGSNWQKAMLNEIPSHVDVKKGDTLVTSEFSGVFPSDILVGIVDEVNSVDGSNFFEISINLSTDFKNVSQVYVVNNLLHKEIKELEKEKEEVND